MSKQLKFAVRYETATVYFDHPVNRTICDVCGKDMVSGEIKSVQGHHWIYKYSISEVKKNPELALENRSYLCYFDHKLADALRTISELKPDQLKRVTKAALLMPPEMQRKFMVICKQFLAMTERRAKTLMEFE